MTRGGNDIIYVKDIQVPCEMLNQVEPKQVELETPEVGTAITGQLQSGADTGKSVVQPFKVAVNVTPVPEVIPVTVLASLSTVPAPAVKLTSPLLTKTIS